jgi:hypothetical protein
LGGRAAVLETHAAVNQSFNSAFASGSTLSFTQSQAGGTLVTSAGRWNFGTASNVHGNAVLLNGGGTGGWATLLVVANGGRLYAQAGDGSWWLWNNPGWSFVEFHA